MATTINKTDGTVLTTVADGAVDQTSTNLAFVGKLYRNYGELINENFVKLLENFASTSSPSLPVIGQLWYDKTANSLKVYKENGFSSLANNTVGNAEPTSPNIGDLWYDTIDQQLKFYTGTEWKIIAPAYTNAQGISGVLPETVTDNSGANHVVNKIYQSGTVLATITKDAEFTPQNSIGGFATIKKGITLANIADFKIHGTVTDAESLDGSFSSGNFILKDQNQTTSGQISIENTAPLVLGTSNEVTFETDGNNFDIRQGGTGRTRFFVQGLLPVQISREQILAVDGTAAKPSITFANDDNTGFIRSDDDEIGFVVGGIQKVSIGVSNTSIDGTLITGDINSSGDITADTFVGTASEALYADLAEKYTTGENHATGTVMSICDHSDHEACPAGQTQIPIGVVSENPAYLMNSEAEGQALALKGRVPVRVFGAVKKGQAVYAWKDGVTSVVANAQLVGIALETNLSDEEKLVECVLKL